MAAMEAGLPVPAQEIYSTLPREPVSGFFGLIMAIRRKIHAPLYSGVELYQIFVSVATFEPRGIKPDFRMNITT
jgi:hypothetical protein